MTDLGQWIPWVYREALALIARGGCENYTGGSRCWATDRIKGAHFTAEAWCLPCIAQDALNQEGGCRGWREQAITAVTKRLRGPLRSKGQPLASENAVCALAESIVDSLPPVQPVGDEVDLTPRGRSVPECVRREYRFVSYRPNGICTGESSMTIRSWPELLVRVRSWCNLRKAGRIKPGYLIRVETRLASDWTEPRGKVQ